MKKLLILAALVLGINLSSNAQGILSKASAVASSAGLDVGSLTSGIMGKLTPSLNLSAAQQPTVTSMIKDFLVQKATALAARKTEPAAAANKVKNLASGLRSKLATVLTVAQLAKFTSLKPAAPSASNVLSQLFY
ncbi:hypothetical protein [Pedobacter sp. Leaf194]|uniref:hypothetical protein n=1 Tax=Pedobacter sp. Leaf194 TaxID=1736297 RepID=UPI000702C27B|nr:hypothetical protein [Pedobacter sp. Leaf194]KQS31650.1 hypothetical protein ASG14_17830 [Pedobacter sp. Leaf194]